MTQKQRGKQQSCSGPPKPKDLRLSPKTYAKLKERRVDGLGAGDTSLLLDFLPEELAVAIFSRLLPGCAKPDGEAIAGDGEDARTAVACAGFADAPCDVRWQTMEYCGQPVPRLVCIQAERAAGGAVPVYRHPVDAQPPVHELSPPVREVVDAARAAFGYPFNHALLQLYRSGDDSISIHSDKTLDIARGAPIVNVSFGASRLFLVRSKTKLSCGTGAETRHHVTLPHNSALAFGLESNRLFTHQIQSDKRPDGQRRSDENSWDGVRVSLTLRVVATFQRLDGRLYGQGATHKTEAALDEALSSGREGAGLAPSERPALEADGARMAEAFRRENNDPDFDWEAKYGAGFDVLAPLSLGGSVPLLAARPLVAEVAGELAACSA